MIHLLGLNWIERLAVRVLTRSDRVGLLVVKPYGSPLVYVTRDQTDPVVPAKVEEEPEPAAHLFERLYHAPSFGEDE